jgi:hypothetical protein
VDAVRPVPNANDIDVVIGLPSPRRKYATG